MKWQTKTGAKVLSRRMGRIWIAATALLLMPMARAAYVVTYYHADGLGTPVMESNAAGVIVSAREYKPYGEQFLGASRDGPGFTGHVGDAGTGLTYMKARYYDPIAARFLSKDPVSPNTGNGANYNRHWYANANPLRFTDPDGMQACSDACMRMREASDRVGGGIAGFTSAQVERFVAVLNRISAGIRHYSEKAAVNFFAINAIALQKKVGREIGANLEERSPADFRVLDFHFDSGQDAANAVTTLPYDGGFRWKAILHTHPDISGFSGLGVYGQNGKYYGLYTSSDAQQAVDRQRNVYVARPDMSILKLDYESWNAAVVNDRSGRKIYADEYDKIY